MPPMVIMPGTLVLVLGLGSDHIDRLDQLGIVLPDELVIVRERSWNPTLPPGYAPDTTITIRLDPWSTIWRYIACRDADDVLDNVEGTDTVVLADGVRHVGHVLDQMAEGVTISSGGASLLLQRDRIAFFIHDRTVASREADDARRQRSEADRATQLSEHSTGSAA